MATNTRVESLIARWEELREQGVPVSLEALCAHCPEVLDEVRRKVALLEGIDQALDTVAPAPDAPSAGAACPLHPPPELPTAIGRYRVIRPLGQGGFGRVYLAHDDELDRAVAIKVPSPERVMGVQGAEAYLREARVLARLDHPHIVPVYDVGRTGDGLCYIVSKFIEGSNLAERIPQSRLAFRESAELVATVAVALHHAHKRGLAHRDLKPANILIDQAGQPFVADFGLALRDEDFGIGGAVRAGTPAYMSPEQARGEAHLVDGRSDIFSLGVVFYELLTGRKPFRGESVVALLDQIATVEPRPPRMIDDAIPREPERIVLKAMAKRATERYSIASDMADDLRHFLDAGAAAGAGANAAALLPIAPPPGSTEHATAIPATPPQPASDSGKTIVKVVPKGLRSFDQHDADFFLELLPGPRDRDGLPESIRFWKTRIEALDADRTFRVGLIHGPSGCGKSSLVKAGVLPRLARSVLSVYIEATAGQTEARLLRGLRKICPDLPAERSLVEALAMLRRGLLLRQGQKALLVLDQFEQWLFARRGEENPELVSALRQCDGEHLQAIVLVRGDFWTAAHRFTQGLEIRLVEGENSAVVDLFDLRHARKVLTAFGRAYSALLDTTSELSRDQQSFLDQAVSSLAQAGKVVPVRLALFAEMVKAKPWLPATLREAGGAEGIGVTFLEETFSAPSAPPDHRQHQKAAQAVLKALLPPAGTNIKGQMRSRDDLRRASGYADRPRDFDELIQILDPELRLITPTEESTKDQGGTTGVQSPAGDRPDSPAHADHSPPRYYQLTHDYLVPSLRDWLTRKQRETRRGRAELRLAERAELWTARPENRHLPSALECACIRTLTRRRDWTERQSAMMRRAGRLHELRALGATAALLLAVLIGLDVAGAWSWRAARRDSDKTIAQGLVDQVVRATIAEVPDIVKRMGTYRPLVDPALREIAAGASEGSAERLRASLALLPVDGGQVGFLYGRLLRAGADEAKGLRDQLEGHRAALTPKLWSALESAKPGDASVLPAASALASYDPDAAKWETLGDKVARALVSVDAIFLGSWIDALGPVGGKLTGPLVTIFQEKERSESEHRLVTSILGKYASADPDRLAELLMVADAKAYLTLFPVAENSATRVLPIFQAEREWETKHSWDDQSLDPAWTKPDAAVVSRIEAAEGLLSEAGRFADCQTMPLDQFLATAEALRKSGYRPVRFRPYADAGTVRVAAFWIRDGRDWRIASGLTADQVRQRHEELRRGGAGSVAGAPASVGHGSPGPALFRAAGPPAPPDGAGVGGLGPAVRAGSGDPRPITSEKAARTISTGYVPVDVAGYATAGADGKPVVRYAALWVDKSTVDARPVVRWDDRR